MKMKSKQRLSRKDFLNLMGLLGASLSFPKGALDGVDVNPVLGFTDAAGRPKRPWWVRKVDEPTIDIKWELKERFNATDSITGGGGNLENISVKLKKICCWIAPSMMK